MADSFNEAYKKKEMSHSQKQAVITLIEKKGKDRNHLENWAEFHGGPFWITC